MRSAGARGSFSRRLIVIAPSISPLDRPNKAAGGFLLLSRASRGPRGTLGLVFHRHFFIWDKTSLARTLEPRHSLSSAIMIVSASFTDVKGPTEPQPVRVPVWNIVVYCGRSYSPPSLTHGLCGTALCCAVNDLPMLPSHVLSPPPSVLVSNSHPPNF